MIATGPLTNVALFLSIYPELVEGIEEIVFMGGGVGLGNRSSSSEFNILVCRSLLCRAPSIILLTRQVRKCDPGKCFIVTEQSVISFEVQRPTVEAAQIVLDVPVRKIMVPLNVTHTALLTRERDARLLDPKAGYQEGAELPKASSPLRHTLSSLLSFFSESYRTTFGFVDGPPLHDALTVAYVARPDLFMSTRFRVDVELGTSLTMGEVRP